MPTGYTAAIEKGITFNQYAMSCARAFGACVLMRDEASDTPIPEDFKPSDWHKKELTKAKRELAKLVKTNITEATELALNEYEGEKKRVAKAIEKDRKLVANYNTMLEKVKAWQAPTPDHVEFKEFMASQIESSIEFDSMEVYYYEHSPKLLSGEGWLIQKKEEAIRNLHYHTREHNAEIVRIDNRNSWIKSLRDSLGEE